MEVFQIKDEPAITIIDYNMLVVFILIKKIQDR